MLTAFIWSKHSYVVKYYYNKIKNKFECLKIFICLCDGEAEFSATIAVFNINKHQISILDDFW